MNSSDPSVLFAVVNPATGTVKPVLGIPNVDGKTAKIAISLGSSGGTGGPSGLYNAETWIELPASEALLVGPVNIWNDAGTVKVRKAIATGFSTICHGFVTETAALGETVRVNLVGVLTGLTGLTIGLQYLSDSAAGTFSSTPPAVESIGHIVQELGFAVNSTTVVFNRQLGVARG